MKHILLTTILAAVILLPPAPRCRVERDGRGYWSACPCAGVTYYCEEVRYLGRTAPRLWIWVTR